jgi:bloom syndrome protein
LKFLVFRKNWAEKIEFLLENLFKNMKLLPNQLQVIHSILSNQDTLSFHGNSPLTYLIPSLISSGITIVIFPLKSSILYQRNILNHLEISSNILTLQNLKTLKNFQEDSKIFFCTPEIFVSDSLLNTIKELEIERFVIDNVHCVSQLGHNFRVDYGKLAILKDKFPKIPILAMTDCTTNEVKEDIVKILNLSSCSIFHGSLNKKNVFYHAKKKVSFDSDLKDISDFIGSYHKKKQGIIYCFSKMDCEKMTASLTKLGHSSDIYHGKHLFFQINQLE